MENILFGFINFRFSSLQDVEGLWWLWPGLLIYFFFGLELLKTIGLNKNISKNASSPYLSCLGIYSSASLSYNILHWGPHVLLSSSASPPPLPTWILFRNFPRNVLLWFWAKKESQHNWWLLSVSTPASPCEEKRISSFLSLISGTVIFRKTELHCTGLCRRMTEMINGPLAWSEERLEQMNRNRLSTRGGFWMGRELWQWVLACIRPGGTMPGNALPG